MKSKERKREAERTARAGHAHEEEDTKAAELPAELEGEKSTARIRFRRGKKAAIEHNVRLEGIKTMGKDAGILVLRDYQAKPRRRRDEEEPEAEASAEKETKKKKKKKKGEEEDKKETEDEKSKLIETLEAVKAPLEQTEVNRLLDEMRPKKRTELGGYVYLTTAEHRALQRKLNKGFTKQQLEEYFVSAHKPAPVQAADAKKTSAKRKGGLARTEWTPGSEVRRPLNSDLALKRKLANKNDLIYAVLRDKWHVVLADEVESPGHLTLTLNPWKIELLSACMSLHFPSHARAVGADKSQLRQRFWMILRKRAKLRLRSSDRTRSRSLRPRPTPNTPLMILRS